MNKHDNLNSAAGATGIHVSKLKLATIVAAVSATALVVATLTGRSTATAARTTQAKPTIVLVHGAWADPPAGHA